jgi:outer membrane receptor for ferrienterochelin and colicins
MPKNCFIFAHLFIPMRFFLIIFLFFFSVDLKAQSLSGIIVGADSNPIPFANVSINSLSIGTSSDLQGKFRLENLEKGSYQLVVSVLGFKKWKKQIQLLDGENLLTIELLSSSYDLEQVVISGTMKESFLSESPVKVDVLTTKFLEKVATSNLMEVIGTVNGVQKQVNCGVCGTNDIHINGMEGPYTLVLIDGLPIVSSLATVYGLNGIPTSLIKQVEIIKGPSSTLYGTEAVAGIINIITKSPNDVSKYELDTYASSHLEKNIDFSFAPKTKKFKMLFSGNYYNLNHFIDDNNDTFSDVPLSERITLFNKWSFDRKSKKILSFSLKAYNENRSGGEKDWFNEKIRGDSIEYGESIWTDRLEFSGSYELPFINNLRLDASYSYHFQDSYYGNTRFEAMQKIYFSNLIWNKKIGHNHDLVMGYTHCYQTFVDSTLALINDKKFIPAVFIQDKISINKDLIFLIGARLDNHKQHGNIFSPRLNIKQNLGTYTSLRLNGGTGFRIVNLFTEDHAFLTGSRQVQVLEDLQPEQSYNVNLNINHIYTLGSSSGTIDFDMFYTYFTNKITPDYDVSPNLIVYDNLEGYAISKGIAFNIQQNFENNLKMSAGGTYLDVYSFLENQKEGELFAPVFSSIFSIGYFYNKMSFDWIGNITGPMLLPTFEPPFQRLDKSPWFSQHDVQLKKDFNSNFSMYLGVKNVFNYTQETPLIDWQNPFGDDFDTSYAYGPLQKRRILIGLSLKF